MSAKLSWRGPYGVLAGKIVLEHIVSQAKAKTMGAGNLRMRLAQ